MGKEESFETLNGCVENASGRTFSQQNKIGNIEDSLEITRRWWKEKRNRSTNAEAQA